ncbi:hypothetical protein SDC9_30522 [bioreactor metagenome]|uniref:Uncharacterized protein n=1 Tax=bioreactor metagenome TaxID=1076179 RepID=A0A644V026_9ZZZZ|nr:hypothetical protein [Methanobrevibacter sp.]MEA4957545.1 hypothetical protein [Methanobrevibacter sp.]
MYPKIDDVILNTLKNSNDSLLKKFDIMLVNRKFEVEPHVIMIGHMSDDPLEEENTFDSEGRKLSYEIYIKTNKIGNLSYIEAMEKLGNVVHRIKKVLRNSEEMIYTSENGLSVDLREGLKIGTIIPEYENYVIKKSMIEVAINIDEEDVISLEGLFEKNKVDGSVDFDD